MCDSSVGGKTGVDTVLGKNLVGSIYNPTKVICNTRFLNTIDKRNFKNGLVEIIKMAAIVDLELFNLLASANLEKLVNDHELLFRIMKMSVMNKVKIIQVKHYDP